MAITKLQPFNLDETKDYTFANVSSTGNVVANNVSAGNVISAAGNVTGNYILGNGAFLTGILTGTPDKIANADSNVYIPTANGNITLTVNANANVVVVTGTGANINGYANITGNANIANIGTGVLTASGNITGANLLTGGEVNATANITTANYFIGNGYYLTGITSGTQPNIANGTSNVSIPVSGGNIELSVNANANVVVVTDTGANVNGYANITGNTNVGNLQTAGEISGTGNITTANYFVGNGYYLTGIDAGVQDEIANGNSNVYIPTANGNVTITVSGNSNIVTVTGTGAVISGTANITGNANVGNIGTGLITAAGNITGANLNTAGQISATGNIETANYVLGNGYYLTGIAVGIQDQIANSNSNVYIPTANGNITFTVGSNANVIVVSTTGANITGALSATGNITGNVFTGNGSGLTNLAGANVTGQVGNALVAGTVYTAAQPNITSVGTLTGLTVGPNSSVILSGNTGYVRANSIQGRDGSQTIYLYYGNVSGAVGIVSDLTIGTGGSGNLTVANGNVAFSGANVSLGNVSNLKIDGGTFNYFLKTDGLGNVSWAAPSISPGGGANELQFNDTGVFAGTANLTYDTTEYRLSLQNYSLVVQALGGVSGSTTVNVTNGTYVTAIAAGITTWIFTFSAPSGNASGFVLELTNGGTYTMNWPLSVRWPGGVAPELTTIGVDVLVFITNDNGTTWRGALSMLNSS
jgi:hypothetical protein